jgi:transposase-like protein
MICFKNRHFKKEIILMLVRWYLAYALSYRDIEELAIERGLNVDLSTVNRWVMIALALPRCTVCINNRGLIHLFPIFWDGCLFRVTLRK